ncbi:MAG TPA: metalloregulator ArsR/SmtB family transcription factor [Actinomycetota bacterium]|nr:metalloregulator ArsR/SmtB family transcription factor [Actinomycetota bacterium]
MKNVERIEDSCRLPLLELPLDELRAERMADAFRVVADSARLRILSVIASKDPEESWVGELTQALGLSQPTVSHHLRVLHEAGLIERQPRGNRTYYTLACDQLDLLRNSLAPRKTLMALKKGAGAA